jgi:hypothetical protein
MNFGTERLDRGARRILAAMIVAGTILTGLSFAMQVGSGAVETRLLWVKDHVGALIGDAEAPAR